MVICFQWLIAFPLALLASVSVEAGIASTSGVPAQELWRKKLTGYVSDLAVSGNGEAVLVATLPNSDDKNGARRNYLSYFDRRGGRRWVVKMRTGVKSLALSDDGQLAVVTTHDNQIQAYDATGKNLWTIEGSCRPFILSRKRKIACYHDEDAEPRVAFDLYSLNGLKLASAPAESDIMALGISADGGEIAVGLTRGQLVAYSVDPLRPLWRARVRGEIFEIGISRGGTPRVAVLYARGESRRIAVFSPRGESLGDRGIGFPADQLDFASGSADQILVYGNGRKGQALALLALQGRALRREWKVSEPVPAYYTQNMYGYGPGGALAAFESERGGARVGEIRSYGLDGALRWAVPLPAGESSNLYTESFAPASGVLAVASDDGILGVFQLRPWRAGPATRRAEGPGGSPGGKGRREN